MTELLKDHYCCTRPRLAARLISKGYKPSFEPNPWNAEFTSWVFPMDTNLCEIVRDFHREIGKEPPQFIMEYIERGAQNA